MTIRLLHDVANDRKGAVIAVDDRRASRLIRTGYAEAVTQPEPVRAAKRWRQKPEEE